ncbi:MAG: ArsR/SmtB family transcription factor [Promethearchaeati archaeon]
MDTLKSCVDLKGVNMSEYFNELKEFGNSLTYKKEFREILEFCNTLGNEERLKIIESLNKQDHCVCELEVILGKSQSTVSHHLRELEKIDLIRGWKKGKFTHYVIIQEKLDYYLNLICQKYRKTDS